MQNLTNNILENINQLFTQGLYFKALDSIENFEKREDLTLEDQVSWHLLKSNIYFEIGVYADALKFAEQAYTMSQELENKSLLVDSHISKAWILLALRKLDFVLPLISKGEDLLANLTIKPQSEYTKKDALLKLIRSKFYFYKTGKINKALEYGEQSLKILEQYNNKKELALALQQNSEYYCRGGDLDRALDYLERCLRIQRSYRKRDDWVTLKDLGVINGMKGELDHALDYTKQSMALAEEIGNKNIIAQCLNNCSLIYRQKGDLNRAMEVLKRNLTIWEEIGSNWHILGGLDSLFIVSLDTNSLEQAQGYLLRIKQIKEQIPNKMSDLAYRINKALILKMSSNSLDQEKAKKILQQIVKEDIINWEITERAILHLCDIFLNELQLYNNQEVLNGLILQIERLMDFAEQQDSFRLLAETNLLLGKFSLIQMNLGEARSFFTKGEHIADKHGLHLLARTISNEHDKLLEQLEKWENLKNINAPVSERLKFVDVDETLNHMLGKQMIEPPDLIEENPILLLIMSDAGDTYFKHTFKGDWDYSDLFSSFISAFNTFSSEIFSKTIDRVKIGKNVIFIKPVEPFLVCYVSKGQSYPAVKKLKKFSDSIKNKPEIWEKLNKAVESSQEFDIDSLPSLGIVVKEIFTYK
ncbi:MAG: tetratricopeptide repeat protein [Candidatus Hermodarchaeota archaeon]